jgi:predicted lipoprotein with Yx(FWY)xxD motif
MTTADRTSSIPAMTRTRSIPLAALAAVALVALVIAGCGGNDDNGNAHASSTPPKTKNGGSATVGVASSSLGKILVDSQGRTIYLFRQDTGTKSTCSGACATDWPPVRVSGKPTAGSGVNASMLGTTPRSDGKPQVTYNGHPLYLFEGDSSPGDTNGQAITAFGAAWYVLSPAGNAITSQSASSGGGGGGY